MERTIWSNVAAARVQISNIPYFHSRFPPNDLLPFSKLVSSAVDLGWFAACAIQPIYLVNLHQFLLQKQVRWCISSLPARLKVHERELLDTRVRLVCVITFGKLQGKLGSYLRVVFGRFQGNLIVCCSHLLWDMQHHAIVSEASHWIVCHIVVFVMSFTSILMWHQLMWFLTNKTTLVQCAHVHI